MKRKCISSVVAFLFFMGLSAVFAASGAAQEHDAFKGVKRADTIFDFRDGTPASALIHLSLLRDTFQDKAIKGLPEKSHFAVVFMASSVKLLSSDRDEFADKEKKTLEELDRVIAAMAKDGIKMEVCLFAAKVFGVDPATMPPQIERVPNGWISSIAYQAKGYVLVPVY